MSGKLVAIQFTFLRYNNRIMEWEVLFKELGKRLKNKRKFARLSQSDLAEQIGITRQYVYLIEKGKEENVSINIILDYLDACKVNYGEFFGQLEKDISKEHFKNVISNVNLHSDVRLRNKVSRDIELYNTKIKGKIGKAIPLSQESRDKAVVKFSNYRVKIENIQALAYKVIAKHAPSTTLNPFLPGICK